MHVLLPLLLTCLATSAAVAQARHPFAVGANEVGAPGGPIGFWLIEQQAVIAIALVGVLAALLGATAARMTDAAAAIETTSYAAVAVLGLWLAWKKGRSLVAALAAPRVAPVLAFAGGAFAPESTTKSTFVCEPVDANHVHDATCGHVHAPDPAMLGDSFSWSGALGTMVAAGARPCSGAILVLVFALAQGLFAVGVASSLFMALGTALTTGGLAIFAVYAKRAAMRLVGAQSPRGVLVARGVEFLAALFVLAVGVALLLGSQFALAIA